MRGKQENGGKSKGAEKKKKKNCRHGEIRVVFTPVYYYLTLIGINITLNKKRKEKKSN